MALCHVEDVLSKSSLQQYAEIPLKKDKIPYYTGIPKNNVYRIYIGFIFITVLTA